ncbi:uncharacterized protein LOC133194818 [Saccostrea echinata]|uniref:uncharacterized protein LOC133194818 n=1 Tax=Saccostrea echinata TaxID=191078 RepID=UPI002A7FC344|nr:uncharacterized protein LOC133194818 [Saccostrea echinata]XP_061186708.1 uncharacterized protein LOC133194818 [Saccostrea echinata]
MNFTTSDLDEEFLSEQSTTPYLFYKSFSIPKKNEIDVVGLAVGVFFCVMGVTLVIYCITRASGCYNTRGQPRTEIKITYFEDDAVTGLSLPTHADDETTSADDDKPTLDTLKIPCEQLNSFPLQGCSETKVFVDNNPFISQGKVLESDTIIGLKRMGIL